MTETLTVPGQLLFDAVAALAGVPRQSAPSEHDPIELSRAMVESLAREIEDNEPLCDHSVGICACFEAGVLEELTMLLDGRSPCRACDGLGAVEEAGTDEYDGGLHVPCAPCSGKGWLAVDA